MFKQATESDRKRIYNEIIVLSRSSRSFYALVAISTIIATYGLLANSVATVIGAMLVAPLMGPIFGVALSICSGDRQLLKTSLTSEIKGMLLSVGIAAVIGLIPLRADFGSEILARIHPTLYDIIVAIACGIAGAYAITNDRLSPALPGVAISTSLVPPLATSGLCLSAQRYDDAIGALLLFAANFLAIELAAAVVFIVFGISHLEMPKYGHLIEFGRRFNLSILALFGISVLLTQTLVTTIHNDKLSSQIQKELSSQLRSIIGAQLSSFSVNKHGEEVGVVAIVLTPHEIEPVVVDQLETILRKNVQPNIRLVIRSLISSDADRRGAVFIADSERERQTVVYQQTLFLTKATETLNNELLTVPGAYLVDLRRDDQKNHTLLTAVVRTPEAINPQLVEQFQNELSNSLKRKVYLIMRCVLTKDIDAQGILYDNQSPKMNSVNQALGNRLTAAIRNQLAGVDPRARLASLRYGRISNHLQILATVQSPEIVTPSETKLIENNLRKYVDKSSLLILRSEVGSDTFHGGYLSNFDGGRLSNEVAL